MFHHDSFTKISITRDCLDRQFIQVARRCVEHVTITQTLVELNIAKIEMGQRDQFLLHYVLIDCTYIATDMHSSLKDR